MNKDWRLAVAACVVLVTVLVLGVKVISPPSLATAPRSLRLNAAAKSWWKTVGGSAKERAVRVVSQKPALPSGDKLCKAKTAVTAVRETCLENCSTNITATHTTAITYPITLVTGYYKMPSKHKIDEYLRWIRLFLLRIKTPMAVFTDQNTLREVDEFKDILFERARYMPGRTNTIFMGLEDPPLAKEFGPAMKKQDDRDPEKVHGHTYWLYMVWMLKTETILAAMEADTFCSEWFMWVDIGVFRADHKMTYWPNLQRLAEIPKDRVLMSLIHPFIKSVPKNTSEWLLPGNVDVIDRDHIVGTFIGLNKGHGMEQKFYHGLWYTHQKLLSAGHLIVKDQTVMNAMFLLMRDMFVFVPCSFTAGVDPWVYLLMWLADPLERPNQNSLTPLLRG